MKHWVVGDKKTGLFFPETITCSKTHAWSYFLNFVQRANPGKTRDELRAEWFSRGYRVLELSIEVTQ